MPLTADDQWKKELTRILRVRGKNVDGLDEVNVRYQQRAGEFSRRKEELLGLWQTQRGVEEAPVETPDEREAASRRLSDYHRLWNADWRKEVDDNSDRRDLDKLLENAQTHLGKGRHSKATAELDKFRDKLQPFLTPKNKTVAIPESAAAPKGGFSDDEIRRALDRPDLYKHMARNDTWGDFDVDAAFGDPSETKDQSKVALNVIESAVLAQRADDQWNEYESIVKRIAVEENDDPQPAPTSTGPATDYDRSRVDSQAPADEVYKLAILGAGASAAYYIANSNVDLQTTVIIGQKDPWAGERGGDEDAVINHPHNMIDPEGRPDFDGGLAKRSEFADRVAGIIERAPHHCDGRISNVKKVKVERQGKQHAYFRIVTSEGIYFAQKVVSALGIGGQINRFKPNWTPAENEVCDMDTFMRNADDRLREKTRSNRIAVSGGNAAIDVVSAIIRKSDAEIHWFCGSSETGPMFLDGTDNDVARTAYNAANEGKPSQVVIHRGRWNVQKDNETHQIEMVLNDEKIPVDEVIYGVGPDVSGVAKIFDESCDEPDDPAASPAPYDQNQHFQLSVFEKDPNRVVDKLKVKDPQFKKKLRGYLMDPTIDDSGLVSHPSATDPRESGPAQTGIDFIGGQQARKPLKGKAKDAFDRFDKNVNQTMPDNVVVGDQLTPSRARIEADLEAMPTTADDVPLVMEEGGVNFITSNQTVIATHIACCYPDVPPGLANYLTAQIVVARNKGKKPLPTRANLTDEHSLREQEEFQEKWIGRLKEIQTEFATA